MDDASGDVIFDWLLNNCYHPDQDIRISAYKLLDVRIDEIPADRSFIGDEALLLAAQQEVDTKMKMETK